MVYTQQSFRNFDETVLRLLQTTAVAMFFANYWVDTWEARLMNLPQLAVNQLPVCLASVSGVLSINTEAIRPDVFIPPHFTWI